MGLVIRNGADLNTAQKAGRKIYTGVTAATSENMLSLVNSAGNEIFSIDKTTGDVMQMYFKGASGGSSVINLRPGYIFFNDGQGVAIGSAANQASAVLNCDSTSKGFMPPRMTTAQKNAISSPATGLVVYDTSLNKLCVYTGAGWETVTSA